MNVFEHAEARYEQYLAQLKELVAIPSVSTLPDRQPDVQRAAAWLAAHLRDIGMTRAEVIPTAGHPIVYAEWLGAPGAPTVLVYGHYDVQPPDPLDEWRTPPFEPTVRDGHLYARGATDDKGQIFAQIKALDALLAVEGRLPVNVKLLFEGEEEIGSPNLQPFVRERAQQLAADAVLISDSGMPSPDQPAITYGTRGMVYLEIEVRGPRADLHSGSYGGTVQNPANVLCALIAALHNPDGSVAVPGFYDRVRPIDDQERAELAKAGWTEDQWRRETGAPAPWGEAGYSLTERASVRPTLDVNGMWSGFTGAGSKTIIPAKANAKVSCRLVPDQDPAEIDRLLRAYIASIAPDTVTVEITSFQGVPAAVMDRDAPAMKAAAAAFRAGFGAEPVFTRAGGTLPILPTFQQALGAPIILMGFGLPDDNIHSPNEKFTLANFRKGIQTLIHFHRAMANSA